MNNNVFKKHQKRNIAYSKYIWNGYISEIWWVVRCFRVLDNHPKSFFLCTWWQNTVSGEVNRIFGEFLYVRMVYIEHEYVKWCLHGNEAVLHMSWIECRWEKSFAIVLPYDSIRFGSYEARRLNRAYLKACCTEWQSTSNGLLNLVCSKKCYVFFNDLLFS